jgi:hypothetical protein
VRQVREEQCRLAIRTAFHAVPEEVRRDIFRSTRLIAPRGRDTTTLVIHLGAKPIKGKKPGPRPG